MRKLLILSVLGLVFHTTVWAKDSNPDPWEGFNRKMFVFNETMDNYALKPAAIGYRKVTNEPVRSTVSNFFSNLGEIKIILSDLGQLKIRQAGSDTARFLINTTVGFFGFFDVARHIGLPKHNEDFGQVLGYWGVSSGPYVMWPFFGPSTVRDTAGFSFEYATNVTLINFGRNRLENIGIASIYAIDAREGFLDLEGTIQGDKYTFIRSFYLQNREYLIHDGNVPNDFGDEDWDDWDEEDEE